MGLAAFGTAACSPQAQEPSGELSADELAFIEDAQDFCPGTYPRTNIRQCNASIILDSGKIESLHGYEIRGGEVIVHLDDAWGADPNDSGRVWHFNYPEFYATFGGRMAKS